METHHPCDIEKDPTSQAAHAVGGFSLSPSMERFVFLTLIFWLMAELILKHLMTRSLYTGRFAKRYELKKILGKRPWWSHIRWLRWLRCFWKYNRGFALTQDQHLSQHESNSHALVTGTTGSGKSINPVLHTILNLEGQSIVLTDTGELYEKTSGYLASQGYLIWKIDVADPEHSDTFNPMDQMRTLPQIREGFGTIVQATMPANGHGNNSFWNERAGTGAKPLMEALQNQPDPAYRNLANVYRLLLEYDREDGQRLDPLIAEYAHESFEEYAAFVRQDPKLRSNSISSAQAALSLWADPAIAQITASTSIDLSLLRKQKIALYIRVPQEQLENYRVFLMLLYHYLFQALLKPPAKNDLDVLVMLEEFANSGVCLLPEFVHIVTTIRKYRCSLMMIVQDIKQMENLIGAAKTTSIVDGGTTHALYLPLQSLHSAQYISQVLGKCSRTYTDPLTGEFRHTTREVMTPDEIMRLPTNTAIYHKKGLAPALIHLRPYFHSRRLRKRARKPPVEITNPHFHEPLQYYPLAPVTPRSKEPKAAPAPASASNGKRFHTNGTHQPQSSSANHDGSP